jgi:ADP-ribose pyrophosphatase YjhB (NUDIX family)
MSDIVHTEIASGKHLSLRMATDGKKSQEYLHEPWCAGEIVSVLGFRRVLGGWHELLVVNEIRPCWGDGLKPCGITGGIDEGETPEEAARREVLEETGYKVHNLIPLGTCRVSKCSDTTAHLFAVDLTVLEAGKAVGDGSGDEDDNFASWEEEKVLMDSPDPLLAVLYSRWRMVSAGDDRRFTLQYNEEEAKVLSRATDLLSRIMAGQWDSVWDQAYFANAHRAFPGLRNGRDIRRELNQLAVDCGLNPHGPNGGPGIHNLTDLHDSARIAFDLHQVIRHALALYSETDPVPKWKGVSFNDPLKAHEGHETMPRVWLVSKQN